MRDGGLRIVRGLRVAAAAAVAAAALALSSCESTPGQVVEKVKYDFGIGEKPEGYESPTDRIMAQLDKVGKTELKRLNFDGRHGEVKFQEEGNLGGKYYKEVKVYEDYRPLEARAITRGTQGERGFVGLIQYSYRVYQSARTSNRTEAAAEPANIRTDLTGRETYRYSFGPGGVWDGAAGQLSRQ